MNLHQSILTEKLIGVVRSNDAAEARSQIKCLKEAGLRVLEISSLNADYKKIVDWVKALDETLVIGVATLLNQTQLAEALDSAADFFVSPVADERMLDCAAQADCCFIPGAFSPSEIACILNHQHNFPIIKLFPAASVAAFEGIKKVFKHPKFLLSGFDFNQLPSLIDRGADLLAIGSYFTQDLNLTSQRVTQVKTLLKRFSVCL